MHLPISISTSDANDCGIPLTVQRPETAVLELSAFRKLAAIVSKELLLLQYGPSTDDEELAVFEASPFEFSIATVSLTLDKIKGREMLVVRLIAESTAIQLSVSPEQLRSRNPKNGDLLPDSPYADMGLEEVDRSNEDVAMVTLTKTTRKRSPSIIPIKVERRGRYGFAIEWGDGATIIYSMRSIAIAAGGKLNQK